MFNGSIETLPNLRHGAWYRGRASQLVCLGFNRDAAFEVQHEVTKGAPLSWVV